MTETSLNRQRLNNTFLQVLKDAICGTLSASIDVPIKDLLDLASLQSCICLIVEQLTFYNGLECDRVKTRQILYQNYLTHQLTNHAIAQLNEDLNKAGISGILLKGQGIARLYRTPELRQCGDIDMYVGPDCFDSVKKINFNGMGKDKRPDDEAKYHITIDGIPVEIHKFSSWSRFKREHDRYQAWASRMLRETEYATFEGQLVKVPTVDFNAFFIFYHMWEHFMTIGVGMRQVCDLAVVLNNGTPNKKLLEDILLKMGLMNPWKAVGCILVDKLGLAENSFPFYDHSYYNKGMKVLDIILKEGNFGKNGTFLKYLPTNKVIRKVYTFFMIFISRLSLFTAFPKELIHSWEQRLLGGFINVIRRA